MSTGRDLDELCEAVADLSHRQSAEECEVKECMDWGMVSAKTVLVVAVVDSHFDADTSVNQTNDCSGHSDEVGVASVGSTSESGVNLVNKQRYRD